MAVSSDELKAVIRDIPDFPQPGILFRDITPLLKNPRAFGDVVDALARYARHVGAELIVGIESRGFVFGAPVAVQLGLGFALARKPGKLPCETVHVEYALEYGTASIELHKDAVRSGMKVVVIDDLLATGGTARAAVQLVERLGGTVAGIGFLIELEFLGGREVLSGYDVLSLVRY